MTNNNTGVNYPALLKLTLKTMFAYQNIEYLHQLLLFYFIKSLYGISNLEFWNHGKTKRERKAILLLSYIADVSCLTNRPFYMRTLSLIENTFSFQFILSTLFNKIYRILFFHQFIFYFCCVYIDFRLIAINFLLFFEL